MCKRALIRLVITRLGPVIQIRIKVDKYHFLMDELFHTNDFEIHKSFLYFYIFRYREEKIR